MATVTRLTASREFEAEALLLAGRLSEERGNFEGARNAYESARYADPRDIEPLQRLARLCFQSNEDNSAERAIRALLAITPEDASAHHNLGSVLLRTSRPSEAVLEFRRSLELRPGSIETRVCLGYGLRAAGDRRGAAETWQAVLASQPDNKEVAEALQSLDKLPA